MARKIAPEFINDVLARVNIVDVIASRIKLKKTGKNYQACCPFHTEKTPSFSVNPEKQYYHCFGCKAHGDSIDFVMQFERLEFLDALSELASSVGLSLPQYRDSHQNEKYTLVKKYHSLMSSVMEYYQKQLLMKENVAVKNYLKQRGLNKATIDKFQLGYARQGWDNLLRQFAVNETQYEALLQCGLLIKNEQQRIYDRFRERLIFPILDRKGNVIAFGGRVLDDTKPKYLNSPETVIFHKSKELYGFYHVLKEKNDIDTILVVEGYLDVIMLSQHGITYAVSSLGTSTTVEQIQLLMRTVKKEIIFCYDGDSAGRKAAWRALETSLPLVKSAISIRFLFLPNNEDPDSFIQSYGKAAFLEYMNKALSFSDFLLSHFEHDNALISPEDKALFLNAVNQLITKIEDPIYKGLIQNALETKLGWGNFQQDVVKYKPLVRMTSQQNTIMQKGIALLLQFPYFGYNLPHQYYLDKLKIKGVAILQEMLCYCRKKKLTTGQLMTYYRDSKLEKHLRQLLSKSIDFVNNIELSEKAELEFFDFLLDLNKQALDNLDKVYVKKYENQEVTEEEFKYFNRLFCEVKKK